MSLCKGQIVVRGQGHNTCVYHRQFVLEWFCKTCCHVICARCISTTHSGHVFIQLSEETPKHHSKIKAFVNDTEKNTLVQLQQEIKSTEHDLQKHLSHFETVAAKVQEQGERLKEEIDVLISQALSQLKHVEEDNTRLILKYRIELETKLETLKQQTEECKKSLQSGTDIMLFDIACGLQNHNTKPAKPCLGDASFYPTLSLNKFLLQAMGKLVVTSPQQSQEKASEGLVTLGMPGIKLSSKEIQTDVGSGDRWAISQFPKVERRGKIFVFKGNLESEEFPEDLRTALGPPIADISKDCQEAKVLMKWKSPCDITSICPASGCGMWTSDNSTTVTLMSNQGRIEKQIENPASVRDISTSPTTHTLWACSHTDNSVTELECGALICRFKTSDIPKCICVTKDDHVLVGMKNKIVKYERGGETIDTVTTTQYGKPLVCTPWKISQCPDSENVAVVDGDKVIDGGKDQPHIAVMNKHLQLIYRYGRPQHNDMTARRPFDPFDVAYDSLGQIIIADRVNHSIHLLSGTGKYLRRLHQDIGAAWFVSLDREGVLWAVVSFGGKQVNRIHYTSK
ncbi:uncharacterized protein LOC132543547 [Ylistrum balloti]|uniref:uncharacterized protein LOC132543547 n=1 Tax=Ylistrum balloti TaxID=509963 RepID=UPI002905D540|nr:uncharacterized protein LOC132543547 [Ylistrum balloti]